MAQIHVDPEQVEAFAKALNEFNTSMSDSIARLSSRFSALGDTWKDEKHREYAAEFQTAMKNLRQFVKSSEEQAKALRRTAEKARIYRKR